MDATHEITEFLVSRRARITPARAGLPTDLARAAGPVASRPRRPAKPRVRPVVQRILDKLDTPAILRGPHADYLAANELGRALYAPLFDSPEQPANSARFCFLDPAAHDFYVDWERVASELVAHLRSEAGRNPYDRGLTDLVGESSKRSDAFRTRWAAHDVRLHRTGTKRIHHPVVGALELGYETLELAGDTDVVVNVYTAEPASRSEEALTCSHAGRRRRTQRT